MAYGMHITCYQTHMPFEESAFTYAYLGRSWLGYIMLQLHETTWTEFSRIESQVIHTHYVVTLSFRSN